MYKNLKVILIGGSPMSGKTTLANKLAAHYKYNCISTDDIGEILQTVTDINPMKGMDYREYYIKKSIEDLCIDVWQYHQQLWPAVKRLVQIHSTWGTPIIIEGWGLYPSLVSKFKCHNIRSIWLLCDHDVLDYRLKRNKEFYQGASDEDAMREKYLQRSTWHNKRLFDDLQTANHYIKVTRNLSKTELLKQATHILNYDKAIAP